MNQKGSTRKATSTVQIMLILACLVIIVAGLKLGSSLFIPVLLALFVATISFPVTNWLRKKGLPRFIAVFLTVLIDFTLIGGVIVFLIATANQLRLRWNAEYLPKISDKIGELRYFIQNVMERFVSEPEAVTVYLDAVFSEGSIRTSLKSIEAQSWWNVSKSVFDFLLSVFGSTFLVVLLTIFMLNEARVYSKKMELIQVANGPNFEKLKAVFEDIQKYLGIKTIISAVTGLCAYTLCYFSDIDFPEFWGVLAFALNYIPAVGSVIAGVPPVILALLTRDLHIVVIVAIGYMTINALLGNFLEPLLLGRKFGLSTVIVVFSVLFWGWIWGPVGMLLGVPLTMLLKVALDNSEYFKWLSIVISKEQKESVTDSPKLEVAEVVDK